MTKNPSEQNRKNNEMVRNKANTINKNKKYIWVNKNLEDIEKNSQNYKLKQFYKKSKRLRVSRALKQ